MELKDLNRNLEDFCLFLQIMMGVGNCCFASSSMLHAWNTHICHEFDK